MNLDEDHNFILGNFPSLLLTSELKAKTTGTGDAWNLHEIYQIHSMLRNIEFGLVLENGSAYLRVRAKINRQTKKFSNIEVNDF